MPDEQVWLPVSDQQRANDLMSMLTNPSVKMIQVASA